MSSTKPLHVLRAILRNLKTKLPADFAGRKQTANAAAAPTAMTTTRDFVLEQYRASRDISSKEEVARLRQLAWDFLALRKDLQEREKLYELDSGAETMFSPKEMSRRAAARAGLQLPDLDPDLK